jgi:tetratricopeptide (TPR) repeat protein
MVAGDFALADQAFDRAWAVMESMQQVQAVMQLCGTQQNNRIISGWNLWFLGYPDRALERMNTATAIAQAPGAPKNILADIHGFATYILQLRGEPEQVRVRAEARLALATEAGFFTGRALSEIYLGWTDAMAGDLDGGIARMRRHMLELKAAGSEYISDRCRAFIAVALGRMGRFDEAICAIEESFPFIERSGQRYYEAELHRLKGELLLARDATNAACAEKCFRTSIEIARTQSAKSWELRTTTSLARLMRDTNRRDEAHRMLAEIYGWFTEGFDTADLKDAKALLEELNR